ncbi:MAG: FG-GAP repeat protein [Kofleriaceae bacterium]
MRIAWLVVVAACGSSSGQPGDASVDAPKSIDAASDASALPPLTQRAYIKSPHPAERQYFGIGVALSSDASRLAVVEGNAVDVYVQTNQTWALEQAIVIGVGNYGVGGSPIAMSGDGTRILAGEMSSDARVFVRNGTAWTEETVLVPAGEQGNDFFGSAVALSRDGTTAVIGAYDEDATHGAGGQTFTGAAHVFSRSGSVWSYVGKILGSNTEANDYFGWSVAASGDGSTIAVGAFGEQSKANGVGGDQTDNSTANAGAAYVFTRTGMTYAQQAYLKSAASQTNGGFGWSLALSDSGDTLIGGAYDESRGILTNSGNAYVFQRSGTTWEPEGPLVAPHPATGALFGTSVAISADGTAFAVGANAETDRTGAAFVFANGIASRYVASNAEAMDEFGRAVALSADAKTLVVGAVGEASSNTDPSDNHAASAGAVYVFE